jgi:uncharacterized protein YecE (DUF72 family)
MTIRVGVAGWDYPDWVGPVYPPGGGRFDRLAYLARFVDVLEINSSFYRPVAPRTAASWVTRTAALPGFQFTAKLYRAATHEESEDLSAAVESSLAGLVPLREAGRLGALLLQYPQSFHHVPEALARLQRTLALVEGWPAVVEVRHRSWDSPAAEEALRSLGAGWCVVDQPLIGRSTAPPTPRLTSRIAYLRLHGRNAADWFREDAGRDARYDYLYSEAELRPLADVARTLAAGAQETIVVQNNHFRGKALANALLMKHILTGSRPAAPARLVAEYPQLTEQVTIVDRPRTLF